MSIVIAISSCEHKVQKWRIVGKEYVPAGMCHDNRKTIVESGVIIVPHFSSHIHQSEPESCMLDLALLRRHTTILVTKRFFDSVKVGDIIYY